MEKDLPESRTTEQRKASDNSSKLERKALQEQKRRLQPGECLKYIRASVDTRIGNESYGKMILQRFDELNIGYELKSQKVPHTISWYRANQQIFNSDKATVELTSKFTEEEVLLLFMRGPDALGHIRKDTLSSTIFSIQSILIGKSITLIIFGLDTHCRETNSKVSPEQLEKALVELQINCGCNCQLIETAVEVCQIVGQYGKAIAEIPYKKEQQEMYENESWYIQNDKKNCIDVSNVAGMKRLWQEQLVSIPQVTLEIAEAIIKAYPLPRLLIEAYAEDANGEKLLADLPVYRSAVPLATARRLGPELSRRVFRIMTSNLPSEIV